MASRKETRQVGDWVIITIAVVMFILIATLVFLFLGEYYG